MSYLQGVFICKQLTFADKSHHESNDNRSLIFLYQLLLFTHVAKVGGGV